MKFFIHIRSGKAGSLYWQTLCARARTELARSVTRFSGPQLCVALVDGIIALQVLFRLIVVSDDGEIGIGMRMFKPSDSAIDVIMVRQGSQTAPLTTGAHVMVGLSLTLEEVGRGCPAQG